MLPRVVRQSAAHLRGGGVRVALRRVQVRVQPARPPSAGTIGAVRGVIAALCFIPMIMNAKKGEQEAGSMNINTEEGKKKFWLAAGELALWNLLAQGCCNVALLFTDATRVSFLTQASIAFTPVLCVMTGDRVAGITWVGCLLALAGVVALGFDGGGTAAAAAQSIGLNLGDIIALIGAAAYSLYIFRIGAFAKMKLPGNLTQAWKTVILAVLYCVWAAADHRQGTPRRLPEPPRRRGRAGTNPWRGRCSPSPRSCRATSRTFVRPRVRRA